MSKIKSKAPSEEYDTGWDRIFKRPPNCQKCSNSGIIRHISGYEFCDCPAGAKAIEDVNFRDD